MLWGDRFEIETLINVRVARAGDVSGVGSTNGTVARRQQLGALPDGIRVLRTILAERRRSSRAAPRAVAGRAPREEVVIQAVRDEIAIAETT